MFIHGQIDSRFYHVWENMKARCYRTTHPDYKNYGARGIILCVEWLNPMTFVKWCEKENPAKGLSIERRNNDLGYSPDNCFFADRMTQLRNRRNSTWVEFKGERMLVSEAARASGIHVNTLRQRISLHPQEPEVWFR